MSDLDLHARLRALDRPRGQAARTLQLGPFAARIEGLDAALAGVLDERWGPFCGLDPPPARDCTLRVLRGGLEWWVDRYEPGEHYRIEALGDAAHRVVASQRFALAAEPDEPAAWRLAVGEQPEELPERIVENATRYLGARLAVLRGGFALHAAGVELGGRAWLFAGASRSGKSTAVRLAAPASSLGDDFALVLPESGGFGAFAMPFDNSERIRHRPPEGRFPVAGIWRLHQDPATRLERVTHGIAAAGLMACTVCPWAMPDLAQRLLDQVEAYARTGAYRELYFAHDAALSTLLV